MLEGHKALFATVAVLMAICVCVTGWIVWDAWTARSRCDRSTCPPGMTPRWIDRQCVCVFVPVLPPAPRTSERAADPVPAPTQEEVRKTVVGSFSTEYSTAGKDEARARNVELAATRVRTVLPPGGEFSFNDAVGPRTVDDGFRDAPVIFMGELAEGVGGGVCQVSSTLHAAALYSAMEIVSRRPHTRRSKYIDAGLDATVAYPPECNGDHRKNAANGANKDCYSVDLVVRNPLESPVEVETSWEEVKEGMNRLSVSFSTERPVLSSASRRTTQSGMKEFERRYRKTGRVRTATYRRLVQSGQPGMNVTTFFTYEMANGSRKEVKYSSEYRPVDELWLVGLQWDTSRPPPWEAGPGL